MAATDLTTCTGAPLPVGMRPGALSRPEAQAAAIIAAFLVLRCAAAALIGLGIDESYSVSVARALHLSYFDHPPLQYWMVHAAAPIVGWGQASRIPFLLLFVGTCWLMFLLTRRLFGARAGVWAVLALNLSGFFTLAAASWVLPDGPLDFWLTGAGLALAWGWFEPAAAPADKPAAPLGAWLAVGACIGLAALSKYQAALFCLGLLAFVLTAPGRWRELTRRGPYLAAALTLLVLAPVMVWNARHGWASFAFQGGRGAPNHRLDLSAPLVALAGQAGVLAPWVFVVLAAAAVGALKAGPRDQRRWLCLMLAAPPICVFTLAPLMAKHTLPHWASPGWLMLFPLAGERLAAAAETRAWPRIWAGASAAALVLLGGLFTWDASSGWIGASLTSLGSRSDPTLETLAWTQVREALGARGLLRGEASPVAALRWNDAGKLAIALGGLAPVTVLSPDAREFAYQGDPGRLVGRDVLIVARPGALDESMDDLRPYFRSITPLAPISVGRRGRTEIRLNVAMGHAMLRPYLEGDWARAARSRGGAPASP
ncbi:MAG: glycosyltransferase family 39 protein [Caulobacteraceae bacterium]|nr:glycosyltransferase family 39 protein [Caulobacteraceae bacterium]